MNFRCKCLWTIGSGKGGVGKSFLTASLGACLAHSGKSVVLVDADLAAPDLHAHAGIKNPECTLLDVLEQRAELVDALIPTSKPGMRLLSCVGVDPGMADQDATTREKMAALIATIDADIVLIDAGTGATSTVLDFFNLSHQAVVVTSPEAASMTSAYRFLRNSVYRRVQRQFSGNDDVASALARLRRGAGSKQVHSMTEFIDSLWPAAPDVALSISDMLKDWRPFLLVNMAVSDQDHRSAEMLQLTARRFLNVDIQCCGPIPFEPLLHRSSQGEIPPDCLDQDGPLAQEFQQAAVRLSAIRQGDKDGLQDSGQRTASSQVMGLNDNLDFMGRALHVQTEDLGAAGNCIITQVFCDGRVILSTKSEYPPAIRERFQHDQLTELMRNQHLNVIRQIESLQLRHQSGAA